MSGPSPITNRPAALPTRNVAPAAPTANAPATAGDSYKSNAIVVKAKATGSSGQNLAQPIGMLMIFGGGMGWLATSSGAAGAFGPLPLGMIGLFVAGMALAGSGVVIKKPDGTSGRAGAAGAMGVIAPGAGLALGTVAALALGVTGMAATAVICGGFLLGFGAYHLLLKK